MYLLNDLNDISFVCYTLIPSGTIESKNPGRKKEKDHHFSVMIANPLSLPLRPIVVMGYFAFLYWTTIWVEILSCSILSIFAVRTN